MKLQELEQELDIARTGAGTGLNRTLALVGLAVVEMVKVEWEALGRVADVQDEVGRLAARLTGHERGHHGG